MKNSRYCIFIERKKGKKRWDVDKSFANAEVAMMKNKVKDSGNKKTRKENMFCNVKRECEI